jgi:hypothetical protein
LGTAGAAQYHARVAMHTHTHIYIINTHAYIIIYYISANMFTSKQTLYYRACRMHSATHNAAQALNNARGKKRQRSGHCYSRVPLRHRSVRNLGIYGAVHGRKVDRHTR